MMEKAGAGDSLSLTSSSSFGMILNNRWSVGEPPFSPSKRKLFCRRISHCHHDVYHKRLSADFPYTDCVIPKNVPKTAVPVLDKTLSEYFPPDSGAPTHARPSINFSTDLTSRRGLSCNITSDGSSRSLSSSTEYSCSSSILTRYTSYSSYSTISSLGAKVCRI